VVGEVRVHRWVRGSLTLTLGVSLLACTGDPDVVHPSEPSSAPAGVTLSLALTPQGRCCRLFTVNPGDAPVTVACSLAVLDGSGHLVYSGFLPRPPPGHRRSSGFEALPGRSAHGFFPLPFDLDGVSYRAPCRAAVWHGGAPI